MNIEPRSQKNLYGLNLYLKLMIDLYSKNKLSNKILLSGPKGIGKSTLAYHFINYIFSQDEEYAYDSNNCLIKQDNRSFLLVEKKSHPNVYNIDLLEEKKSIDVAQIKEMISYANKSSFNNKPKLVLIDNVENLNTNSLNALLKIVEEPNENLFFLLVHDSRKRILDTLKSRCINFKLNLKFEETIKISNKILEESIFDFLNEELINYYITPGEIINLINFSKKYKVDLKKKTLKDLLLLLITENYYSKDKFIKLYIFNIIQIYFLKQLYNKRINNNIYLLYNKFVNMIYNCNKFNLNYENLFIEFKTKVLNE